MNNFKLRNYQLEAVEANIRDLQTASKIINVLPTASGKTEIMAAISERYQGGKVLILSHLTELVTQTRDRVKLRTNLETGIMQAENYPTKHDQVIVGTRQTVSNVSNLSPFKNDIGLIIIDEVHGFLTKQYETIMKELPNVKIIGFTATPYRNAKLITNFFDKISYSKSLLEMIEEGYVVRPILKPIKVSENAELGERIAQVIRVQKTTEKGKSGAIFMQRIEDCKLVRNICKMNNISCCIVTSKTKKDIRDQRLKDFQAGKIEILVTCNVVSEGFDCPRLEVIYMPYQTSSPTLFIQRMGRAMRLFEGKESCRVYAFGDSPKIKQGFYTALKMGEKKKMNVKDDMEFLELTGEITSEAYLWGKELCKIAKRLRELGKVNLAESLLNKEFPKKYMKNPDLVVKYMDKIETDDVLCLENSLLSLYGADNEYHITEGNMKARHVKDTPWAFKKLAWVKDGYKWKYDSDTYKKIRKYYRMKKRVDKAV